MSGLRPALRIVSGNDALLQRREFDHLGRIDRAGVTVERISADDIPELLAFAARAIPALSSAEEAVARVVNRNRDSAWAFRRGTEAAGVYAMVHLSKEGLEALLLGEFNTSFPDPSLMVKTGEAPAAIYKWAVVAPGMASVGICTISRMLQADRFSTANLYARPATFAGGRLMARVGFLAVRSGFPDLHRYTRIVNRGSGLVDGEL